MALSQEQKALRRKAYNAAYYANNPDRGRDRRKEKADYYRLRGGKERKAQRMRANPGAVNAEQARRRAMQLKATPPWADLGEIRRIYERASVLGLEVDHIIPLRNKIVCGLHVEANLQLLTAEENLKKGNKFEVL
ncbi:MAG: HNH endonuclease signature motif containing protein [Bacillota bacterium]